MMLREIQINLKNSVVVQNESCSGTAKSKLQVTGHIVTAKSLRIQCFALTKEEISLEKEVILQPRKNHMR